MMMSYKYCVVFFLCVSSSCVPHVAIVSWLYFLWLPLRYSLTFIYYLYFLWLLRRTSPPCRKSLTTFIIYCCMNCTLFHSTNTCNIKLHQYLNIESNNAEEKDNPLQFWYQKYYFVLHIVTILKLLRLKCLHSVSYVVDSWIMNILRFYCYCRAVFTLYI
jgi:hypothetical protein